MKEWWLHNFSVRSLVILMLVMGSIYLAVVDERYRARFADLAYFGLGGYFGQLVPKGKS